MKMPWTPDPDYPTTPEHDRARDRQHYDYTDPRLPAAVSSPLYDIHTKRQEFIVQGGTGPQDVGLPAVNVDMRRTIQQDIGGQTGVPNRQGYDSGIQRSWKADRFHGGAVQFVTRDLTKDIGPVGVSNRAGVLKSAVEAQYSVPPSMEEIYASIIGGR